MKKTLATLSVGLLSLSMFTMLVPQVRADTTLRAWKDGSTLGLENDHLYLHGSAATGNFLWFFDYLVFKDTGTTWYQPWGELAILVYPSYLWRTTTFTSYDINAYTEADKAYLTYSVVKDNLREDIAYTVYPDKPYIYITLSFTNVGSVSLSTYAGAQFTTWIAGDNANDYFYVPGHGQGQFTGVGNVSFPGATETWVAMWDMNKGEGCGMLSTKGFTPSNMITEDFGIGEGFKFISDNFDILPGQSSATYDCYLYFFTGVGWEKTKDFYDARLTRTRTEALEKAKVWLVSMQNSSDGGFDGGPADLYTTSDAARIAFTYFAVSILSWLGGLSDIDAPKAASFIASKQRADGSFPYIQWDRLMENQYYAIAALEALSELSLVDSAAFVNRIISQQQSDGTFGSLASSYFAISTLDIMGYSSILNRVALVSSVPKDIEYYKGYRGYWNDGSKHADYYMDLESLFYSTSILDTFDSLSLINTSAWAHEIAYCQLTEYGEYGVGKGSFIGSGRLVYPSSYRTGFGGNVFIFYALDALEKLGSLNDANTAQAKKYILKTQDSATGAFYPSVTSMIFPPVAGFDLPGLYYTYAAACALLTLALHDVAMMDITHAKTVVSLGYRLNISVTAANPGDYPETFNITVYYGNGTFTPEQWNVFWSLGDCNRDGYINEVDALMLADNFGRSGPNPCDLNSDGLVDILDAILLASGFGKQIWQVFLPVIDAQTIVDLAAGDSVALMFTWNITGIAYGNYIVTVIAKPVANETNTFDNNCTCSIPIHVGVPGDISGPVQGVYDGKCDMRDISHLVLRFNNKPGSANWNPNADINNDATVNMRDIAIAILNFNKHE